ncbi:hypothetical protein JCM5350_004331 [Sporobolomyces pararoseus]
MFRLLPILVTLPLVLAVEHSANLPHESGFSRVVVRSNQNYQPMERRAGGGGGGIQSMVTDLLGGEGGDPAQSTATGTSKAVSTRERGAGRGSSVASEQTAQVGLTFQTTALATPTSNPPLSTKTASSSVVIDTGSNPISSNPSSSPSISTSLPLSEQTLSSATGVVTSALLTSPSPSSISSALSMSTSTLLSSSTSGESASSTTEETSTSSEEETTTSSETQAPDTPTQVLTQQAVSTAEAVTILSTLSDNGGGVVTIYSTAGQQNAVPSSSSLNSNSATALSRKGGLAMSLMLVVSVIGFLL